MRKRVEVTQDDVDPGGVSAVRRRSMVGLRAERVEDRLDRLAAELERGAVGDHHRADVGDLLERD